MLSFKGYDFKGAEIALPEYADFEISREENVPADYLEVRFPYFENNGRLSRICLYDNDGLLFKGICDEIVNIKSASGVFVRIYCRNMFALLIDNEAAPGTFTSITAQIIFDRYLKPLGFKDFAADGRALSGDFTVAKGTSVYSVLSEFCRIKYNATPRLSEDNVILFNPGDSGEKVVFSDKENKNRLNYSKIEFSICPCKLISKINVKTSETDFYTSALHNSFAENMGIVRERYLDSCSESTPMTCGYTMFKNTNKQYEEYSVHLNGLFLFSVGTSCEIYDFDLGDAKELYVSKVRCRSDKRGNASEITLKRKC